MNPNVLKCIEGRCILIYTTSTFSASISSVSWWDTNSIVSTLGSLVAYCDLDSMEFLSSKPTYTLLGTLLNTLISFIRIPFLLLQNVLKFDWTYDALVCIGILLLKRLMLIFRVISTLRAMINSQCVAIIYTHNGLRNTYKSYK